MHIAENPQAKIRKKAVLVFVIVVLLTIIQISLFYIKIDRISTSVINTLIFWPMFLIALYQSISVVTYSIRYFRTIKIAYVLLTIPVFVFLIYFVRELIVTY